MSKTQIMIILLNVMFASVGALHVRIDYSVKAQNREKSLYRNRQFKGSTLTTTDVKDLPECSKEEDFAPDMHCIPHAHPITPETEQEEAAADAKLYKKTPSKTNQSRALSLATMNVTRTDYGPWDPWVVQGNIVTTINWVKHGGGSFPLYQLFYPADVPSVYPAYPKPGMINGRPTFWNAYESELLYWCHLGVWCILHYHPWYMQQISNGACYAYGHGVWHQSALTPGHLGWKMWHGGWTGWATTANGGIVAGEQIAIATPPPTVTDDVGAGGDPHATNLDGAKFNIMATGHFSLLTISQLDDFTPRSDLLKQPLQHYNLAMDGFISQVEKNQTKCTATFIQNISLSGSWVGNHADSKVSFRAVHWVPKEESLQVRIDNKWYLALEARDHLELDLIKGMELIKGTSSQLAIDVHGIQVHVSVGTNARKIDQNKGYNFLNLQLKGLGGFNNHDYKLGGILGHSDPAALDKLSQPPLECRTSFNRLPFKGEDMTFLSMMNVE